MCNAPCRCIARNSGTEVTIALLLGALAYLVGVALGGWAWGVAGYACPWPAWLWLVPVSLLPFTSLLNRLRPKPATDHLRWPVSAGFEPVETGIAPAWPVALLLCCLAGNLRYASEPNTACWAPSDLAYYNLTPSRAQERSAPTVTLTGFVSNYPVMADYGQDVEISATSILADDVERPVDGTALLTTYNRHRYIFGQPLRVTGQMSTPSAGGQFSYRDHLLRKGVTSQIKNAWIEELNASVQGNGLLRALYAIRGRGEVVLGQILPEPYAALANGMLLGVEAGIPKPLYDQFTATGSSHVIVISGSNVAIISGAADGDRHPAFGTTTCPLARADRHRA